MRIYKYAIVYASGAGWDEAENYGAYRIGSRHNTLRAAVTADCMEQRRTR